jgi:LIM domain kinase 1
LVTANGRLKITDFGFARIAARNQDESKRLTFCGTDFYMSPEILRGEEFDLPTDIFSLGIIFCEISARTLADDHHFKRSPPRFGIDKDEVYALANPGCPPAFLELCLECLAENPYARPTMRVVLDRLSDIEADVLARASERNDVHVGSVKFMSNALDGKRQGLNPRIPSFGVGIGQDIRTGNSSEDDSDGESPQAITKLDGQHELSGWISGTVFVQYATRSQCLDRIQSEWASHL